VHCSIATDRFQDHNPCLSTLALWNTRALVATAALGALFVGYDDLYYKCDFLCVYIQIPSLSPHHLGNCAKQQQQQQQQQQQLFAPIVSIFIFVRLSHVSHVVMHPRHPTLRASSVLHTGVFGVHAFSPPLEKWGPFVHSPEPTDRRS
jgi:hypothetical protein